MDRDRERNAEDEEAPVPESGGWQQKLKLAAYYAFLAFAPVVSVVALIVALVVNGHRSDQAQLGEANARIDKLEANLQASRAEVETLKLAMAHEKSLRGDERKKDEELNERIVQNVSRLQAKLKVAPTLEEQLRVSVPASHVEGAAPVAAIASAPAAPEKFQAASVPAPVSADKKPAAPVAAPKAETKKKAPEVPAKKAEQKMSPQVKAIKDAIDQYNRQ
jgi:hypothetical protein